MVEGKAVERELWPKPASARLPGRRDISRLDREVKWLEVEIATFLEESKALGDIDRLTRVVFGFVAVPPRAGGLTFEVNVGDGLSAKELFEDNKVLAPVRELYDYDEWLKKDGARASEANLKRKIESIYGGMARVSKRHTATMASKKFSDFHAKDLEQSLEWRKEAEEALDALLEENK
jgi:hypothetical protein